METKIAEDMRKTNSIYIIVNEEVIVRAIRIFVDFMYLSDNNNLVMVLETFYNMD